VIAGTIIDLVGAVGRAVLEHPMPGRRLRLSPRAVKRPMSRYARVLMTRDCPIWPAITSRGACGCVLA